MVFIGIDEPLFDKHERNLTEVVQLAQDHVDSLNEIFIAQVGKKFVCETLFSSRLISFDFY